MKKHLLSSIGVIFSLIMIFQQTHAQNKPATDFTLVDINGNKVSLSDFKGKVVYIDFWATWCGPCVAEIPYSKKLKEYYKDNTNIVFLYVSFDDDVKRWKKFVDAKEMKGVQTIADGAAKKALISQYNIMTIPRFMLIDKQGNIADMDAKRPSDSSLAADINKLLGI